MQLRSFVGCGESEELKCAADEKKEGICLFFRGRIPSILKGKDSELNDVLTKPIYLVRTSFGRTKIKCYFCIDAPFFARNWAASLQNSIRTQEDYPLSTQMLNGNILETLRTERH